jgi:hypothetical protein
MLLTGQPLIAERRAAVHAARALYSGLLVGKMMGELTPVLDALPGRFGGLVQALELHESRDLTHRVQPLMTITANKRCG